MEVPVPTRRLKTYRIRKVVFAVFLVLVGPFSFLSRCRYGVSGNGSKTKNRGVSEKKSPLWQCHSLKGSKPACAMSQDCLSLGLVGF